MRAVWWYVAALCGVLSARADAPPACAELLLTSAVPGDDGGAGAALSALAVGALAARGVRARAVPPPPQCAAPASAECRLAVDRRLTAGNLTAAILPTPAALAPLGMNSFGLAALGDAAPPWRRVCRAGGPAPARAARSLLDLADEGTAALYDLTPEDVASVLANNTSGDKSWDGLSYPKGTKLLEICATGRCATLLTSTTAEADEMATLARLYTLRVRIVPLGTQLPAAESLRQPFIACDALNAPPGRLLGPPPCINFPCTFESYRLLKLVNKRAPELTQSALHVLSKLHVTEKQLTALGRDARAQGAEVAAREFLMAHPVAGGAGEVRVLVMLPVKTPRELALQPRALAAAAALAVKDEETARKLTGAQTASFKVETFDDECSGSTAYKHLSDALGTGEYGALSAVAGPACGAAFADVAKQSKSHVMPVLAYTVQAADSPYVLRAAGDARDSAAALGALLAAHNWRRLAALTEPATRAVLDAAGLRADVVVHTELPDADAIAEDTSEDIACVHNLADPPTNYQREPDEKLKPEPDYDLISQWARRAATAGARVLLAWPEDARALRSALCAGRAAGFTPLTAVWILPPLAPESLLRAAGDRHPCSTAELQETAEGHLSLAPEWQRDWSPPADWTERWRQHCEYQVVDGACSRPPPGAALLYDVLRLWAAALARLLARRPSALDDLHHEDLIKLLIADVESPEHNYTGLTGQFTWTNGARAVPLRLLQWDNATQAYSDVGDFAGKLTLGTIRWRTADGAAPDDGAEPCALQPLADALRADCRVALGTLLALLLTALAAALGGAGWLLKRRLEKRYRARLAALGLTTLAPKLGALDRWELPRERVVINRKLGVGAFGTVYGGHALLTERRAWTAVAVKTLKPGAGMAEKLDFLAEAEAMKRLEHPNVVRLLGVVTQSEPVCTVMEFMLYGDLKSYLLARRHLLDEGGEAADEISPTRLTSMAVDAARALSYLAQLRFVHRDVAARNCLVSARRQLKLADFGMARPVCESDYYRFSRKGLLPVRWMAPESLSLGVFSPASDVWSLGVLLYEIVTFGALPYQGLGNAQVLARVTRGRALQPPLGLQPSLEGLMKSCWQQEPAARPSAAAVAAFLADAPRLLTPCLVPLDALPLDDHEVSPLSSFLCFHCRPWPRCWPTRRGCSRRASCRSTRCRSTTTRSVHSPRSSASTAAPGLVAGRRAAAAHAVPRAARRAAARRPRGQSTLLVPLLPLPPLASLLADAPRLLTPCLVPLDALPLDDHEVSPLSSFLCFHCRPWPRCWPTRRGCSRRASCRSTRCRSTTTRSVHSPRSSASTAAPGLVAGRRAAAAHAVPRAARRAAARRPRGQSTLLVPLLPLPPLASLLADAPRLLTPCLVPLDALPLDDHEVSPLSSFLCFHCRPWPRCWPTRRGCSRRASCRSTRCRSTTTRSVHSPRSSASTAAPGLVAGRRAAAAHAVPRAARRAAARRPRGQSTLLVPLLPLPPLASLLADAPRLLTPCLVPLDALPLDDHEVSPLSSFLCFHCRPWPRCWPTRRGCSRRASCRSTRCRSTTTRSVHSPRSSASTAAPGLVAGRRAAAAHAVPRAARRAAARRPRGQSTLLVPLLPLPPLASLLADAPRLLTPCLVPLDALPLDDHEVSPLSSFLCFHCRPWPRCWPTRRGCSRRASCRSTRCRSTTTRSVHSPRSSASTAAPGLVAGRRAAAAHAVPRAARRAAARQPRGQSTLLVPLLPLPPLASLLADAPRLLTPCLVPLDALPLDDHEVSPLSSFLCFHCRPWPRCWPTRRGCSRRASCRSTRCRSTTTRSVHSPRSSASTAAPGFVAGRRAAAAHAVPRAARRAAARRPRGQSTLLVPLPPLPPLASFLADAPRLLTPCLVPLDALPLDDHEQDMQERWASWAAPPSAATDTTYLSADTPADPPETQRFLP